MYNIQSFRSRKPLELCTPAYKARRKNFFDKTLYQSQSSSDNSTSACALRQSVEALSVSVDNSVQNLSESDVHPTSDHHFDMSDEQYSTNQVTDDDSDSDKDLSSSVKSDDEASLLDTVEDFETRLAQAFTATNMSHVQAKAVLHVIRSHQCFSTIHVDPRSILQTPSVSSVPAPTAGGEYLHLGVKEAILRILQATADLHLLPDVLEVDYNTDGASLDKNGKIVMWPIQIRIPNIENSSAEVVGIFRGSSKPSSAKEFFTRFIDEFLVVARDGIQFCDRNLSVRLRCFIADAPARAFALDHRGHNSTAPCSRCWVRGRSVRTGVMVYEGTDFVARTEEEYSSRVDILHHKGPECPIALLSNNVVSTTVFDYMHLTCLGVMEKIFLGIIDGRFSNSAKLSPADVTKLNSRLNMVKEYCPDDFARKPGNIIKHGKFKATEFRQILLYSGPVIFYGIMNSDAIYKHFLLLHTAMRILTGYFSTTQHVDFAEQCIKLFVETASEIYGIEFLSYNIHALLHLADDVRSFGSLECYSAFPYENNMTYFRKMCRKPDRHLQQIANIRAENCHVNVRKHFDKNSVKFVGKHSNGPKPPIDNSNYQEYRKVVKGSSSISIGKQNSTITLKNGAICVVKNIIQVKNDCYLLVQRFLVLDNYFDLPCASSSVGVFLCSSLSEEMILIRLDDVENKCFRMPYWSNQSLDIVPEYFVVMKMLSLPRG